MISCRRATELMSQQLDHSLPIHKKIALRLHTNLCRACFHYGQQIKSLQDLLTNLDENTPTITLPQENLSEETKQKIKKSLSS